MKLRQEHVDATGGCAECQFAPVAKGPAAPGGASVLIHDPTKPGWIGLELVDTEGRPVPGEAFEVTLPDQQKVTGTLDGNGKVRIEGIDPGTCTVTFPAIDRRDVHTS